MNEIGKLNEQEEIDQVVKKLESLRDDWSDEIPEDIKHSTSEDKMYKVRGSWYQGITPNVEELLYLRGIEREDLPEIQELLEYFTDEKSEFREKISGRTDASDIDKGNRLIELALKAGKL